MLIRRAFRFADGAEAARGLLLTFEGQRLTSIKNANNQRDLGYVRMDPVLLDRLSGEEIEDRILLRINEVPKEFIDTLLTVEDRDFYQHGGVSPLSIGRAFFANLKAGVITSYSIHYTKLYDVAWLGGRVVGASGRLCLTAHFAIQVRNMGKNGTPLGSNLVVMAAL